MSTYEKQRISILVQNNRQAALQPSIQTNIHNWKSLQSLYQQRPVTPTTEQLKAEIAREAYEAEHGFDNLLAQRNAQISANVPMAELGERER
jgi:hypothetical protein